METVKLKYFQKVPNAGDVFSARLAQHVFGLPVESVGEEASLRPNLILVGSILHWADADSLVCGAGFILSGIRTQAPPRSMVLVRGRLSAESLRQSGLEPPALLGDPGVMAPQLFPGKGPARYRLAVVPHYVDLDTPWVCMCRDSGIKVIDPRAPLEIYFDELRASEVILASSLHGLIFAHAFGLPALWVEPSDGVIGDGFKFYDYYSSVGLEPGQVRRVRVGSGDAPDRLAHLATEVDHAGLRRSVEYALELAERGLRAQCASGLARAGGRP